MSFGVNDLNLNKDDIHDLPLVDMNCTCVSQRQKLKCYISHKKCFFFGVTRGGCVMGQTFPKTH